ncbi:MAG: family 20 glycosylhydrolase [Tannerellaceae bacterium]|nr:family 20 glycosylhydrolase [Tannerellaceae bacterium]MCD8263754.1 family 20 glycosylhydrolase [Tannerellaceae bacterium]
MQKLMLQIPGWLSLLLLLLASCSSREEEIVLPEPAIIPLPVYMEVTNGSYTLTRHSAIRLQPATDDLLHIAGFLNEKISTATGFTLPVKKDGKIELILNENETLGEEGYTLSVTRLGVQITANQPAGLFYGVQSLLQLLPPEIKSTEKQITIKDWKIPAVEIIDKPQFAWRGLMLDVSRHWFTKEEVKRYIDQLAEYKMNVFHWHLTDDQGWRMEIKSLPELTAKGAWRAPRVGQWWQREPWQPGEATTYGGYYTHEDIKEVLAYAAERYVRVIPEIDVPGHSIAALFAYPQLACLKAPASVNVGEKFYTEVENSLCIGKAFTLEFMDKVLTEVAALFPDEYVHIGGDECYKGFWQKCPDCQRLMKKEGLKDVDELQSWFIHRMEDLLKEKGKKLIGWDEIHEGGLFPDVTVMSWRGMEGGIKAAEAGHHVIMTPASHCYLDLYQGEPSVEPDTYSMARLTDSYHFNPVPEDVPEEMILGGQGNLWTESVPTFRHAEYMTWPRGWALAEVLWSGPVRNDWKGFIPRVEHHFERADQAQVNYARSMYNAIITPYLLPDDELIIELSTEIPGLDIYYTFDNTDPDRYTSLYREPLRVLKNATWLRVVTYRGEEPVGKVITLTIGELEKRAQSDRRPVIGNLTW